ncbi:hypothetical protein [Amycolatopsis magusensis]|uniref:Uncharacterized protein n=1 Tax=Amycolatopsis magusensis TaxID=882444 RepID=A0ABS4PWP6_9PSEU|nr:hypothetical protein [Amycolatopsis magusensis]MBP2183847.1 hypothetical protein [Amycolatopsis magusensis]
MTAPKARASYWPPVVVAWQTIHRSRTLQGSASMPGGSSLRYG